MWKKSERYGQTALGNVHVIHQNEVNCELSWPHREELIDATKENLGCFESKEGPTQCKSVKIKQFNIYYMKSVWSNQSDQISQSSCIPYQ